MKQWFLGFIFIFTGVYSSSSSARELHLFLPGLQYRYENDSDQTISNRRYDNFNIAGIIFDDYLIGGEYNQHTQETSSGSISITEKFQEFNLYVGYFFYSKLIHEQYKIVFDIGPVGYLGQNRGTVETVLGSVSQKSEGEDNLVYGLGLQATLRVGYILIQPEMRYASSRSYQPSNVPLYGVRLGFRIGL